jgi:hypothetical protein
MAFLFKLLLLAVSIHSTICLDGHLPAQTVYADDRADLLGWTPKPTALPEFKGLIKRDPVPSGTCGYVTNDEGQLPKQHVRIGLTYSSQFSDLPIWRVLRTSNGLECRRMLFDVLPDEWRVFHDWLLVSHNLHRICASLRM